MNVYEQNKKLREALKELFEYSKEKGIAKRIWDKTEQALALPEPVEGNFLEANSTYRIYPNGKIERLPQPPKEPNHEA